MFKKIINKRSFVFLEFLVGGVIFGILEDIILIKIVSNQSITPNILLIIFSVILPFAFLGEYIIDKIDFLKIFKLNKKYRKIEIFLEFLIFGIILGVIEDIVAFYFSIQDPITLEVFLTATLVAIPFAIVGEFLFDRINFKKSLEKRKIEFKKPEHP
ncbi:MAG TPA: hypothetical protein VJ895_02855 [Candidatus Nanoarchaeia archaeon]|nr:hypothetical protein [Candidatus Nanoarchaeia archaeon]